MENKSASKLKTIEEPKNDINIGELLSQAISQNVSVDTVERLLAIRKQLRDEWASEQFDRALAAFQGECPVVEKRKKVSFATTNYSYAPLEDIVEQVKPLLAKHGFSYMFDTQTNGKMKVICKVKHVAGHSEVATFDMEIDTNAKMNVSQKYGSALTYAKRYAFCAAFAINVKDEDTDANAPVKPQQAQPSSSRDDLRVDEPTEDASEYIPTYQAGNTSLICMDCDKGISQKVFDFSTKKYGRSLCMSCQKGAIT